MGRKKSTVPKWIKDKYGEHFKIWSYSNISSIGGDNCPWEYYLSRIEKNKGIDGIYGILGGLGHQQLEDFYNKTIPYEDMLKCFQREYIEVEMGEYKFHSDTDTHDKRSGEYMANLVHFFKNHNTIPYKVLSEVEIWIDILDNVFVGYVDAIHKDTTTGKYVITDWKTSSYGSEYKGDKLLSKSHQLLLYAYALHRLKKIPLDKIEARWCFMKYCNVDIRYFIKTKKEPQQKERVCERRKWVEENKSQLRKDIERYYPELTELERDILLERCIGNNNLDCLCEELKGNYQISDFYLYAEINDETISELIEYIGKQVELFNDRGSDPNNWERDVPISYVNEYGKTKDVSFYCNTLCGQRLNCKYHKEYIENLKTIDQKKQESEDYNLLDELDALM